MLTEFMGYDCPKLELQFWMFTTHELNKLHLWTLRSK